MRNDIAGVLCHEPERFTAATRLARPLAPSADLLLRGLATRVPRNHFPEETRPLGPLCLRDSRIVGPPVCPFGDPARDALPGGRCVLFGWQYLLSPILVHGEDNRNRYLYRNRYRNRFRSSITIAITMTLPTACAQPNTLLRSPPVRSSGAMHFLECAAPTAAGGRHARITVRRRPTIHRLSRRIG